MKKIILITALLFSASLLAAQTGSWKIKINNKTILTTSREDTTKNKKTIRLTEWEKRGNLEIFFLEDDKDTWVRSFLFYDRADNEIFKKDSSTHVKIPIQKLKKLFAGKKEIIIYTTISPIDPTIAIRMRRVHLCTLRLP